LSGATFASRKLRKGLTSVAGRRDSIKDRGVDA